jgi:hypothetical protein
VVLSISGISTVRRALNCAELCETRDTPHYVDKFEQLRYDGVPRSGDGCESNFASLRRTFVV